MNSVPFGIGAIDLRGEVMFCNDLFLKHLSIDQTPASVKHIRLVDHLWDLAPLAERLSGNHPEERAAFELSKIPFRHRYLTISGRQLPEGLLLTTFDLTQEVEREVATLQTLVEAQEMERRRLAKEIHDGIGPLLSTLKLCLEGMKAQMGNLNEAFNQNYHNALDLLAAVTRDIRHISHDLMPGALIDFGLVAALENLCRKANQSGLVQVNFYHAGINGRLEERLELSLYRIAQELLGNVFKHARAHTANVQLIRHLNSIVLMVEDDGAGFDRRQLRNLAANGTGLRNIRTRVLSLGGSFTIESQPDKGVLATIEIPMP